MRWLTLRGNNNERSLLLYFVGGPFGVFLSLSCRNFAEYGNSLRFIHNNHDHHHHRRRIAHHIEYRRHRIAPSTSFRHPNNSFATDNLYHSFQEQPAAAAMEWERTRAPYSLLLIARRNATELILIPLNTFPFLRV